MDDLVKTALLGTAKAVAAPLDEEHPVDAFFGTDLQLNVEDQLLLRAGAHTIFEQAGCEFPPLSGQPPAPPETAKVASKNMTRLLRTVWISERRDLLGEFIDHLREAAVMLPPELLPEALATQLPAFRERLFPILGARGHWLACWQEDWHWATLEGNLKGAESLSDLRRFWDEGGHVARVAALQQARGMDAASASGWLAETWKQEKADDRRTFLETLKVSLSMDDEEFLDAALKDRSEGVRQAAVELLSLLPESVWAVRMRGRADQLLVLEQTGLIKKKKHLRCRPPEELPDEWARDGIGKSPPAGSGKRAFWTQSVLRYISPAHWEERFSLNVDQLIAAVADDEYADSVIAGWTIAVASFIAKDATLQRWLAPLWNHWFAIAQKNPKDDLNYLSLISQASPSRDRERFLRAWLETDHHLYKGLSLLSDLPKPWSPEFATFCLDRAVRMVRTRGDKVDAHWAWALCAIARNLPRELLTANLATCLTNMTGAFVQSPSHVERSINEFQEIIQLRQEFFAELSAIIST